MSILSTILSGLFLASDLEADVKVADITDDKITGGIIAQYRSLVRWPTIAEENASLASILLLPSSNREWRLKRRESAPMVER